MAEITFTYDVVNIKCHCCGRMIPAKPLKKKIEGKERLFCSRECDKLFREYVLPQHGG